MPDPAITRLNPRLIDKPWGRSDLDPCFGAPAGRTVGEIWFERPNGAAGEILAKYLFTGERLSVQVHPDDDQAKAAGLPSGKDECWLVVAADESAEWAVGLKREASVDEVVAAARAGSIIDLLDWRKPVVGEFLYNPAGTIHALGPGLTVLEIQQAADVTYRLYDYGRDRPLHLDQAAAVMRTGPHHDPRDTIVGDESRVLVDGPKFGVAWCVGRPPLLPNEIEEVQLVPVEGQIGGTGPGQCVILDGAAARALSGDARFVLAWATPA